MSRSKNPIISIGYIGYSRALVAYQIGIVDQSIMGVPFLTSQLGQFVKKRLQDVAFLLAFLISPLHLLKTALLANLEAPGGVFKIWKICPVFWPKSHGHAIHDMDMLSRSLLFAHPSPRAPGL